MKTEQLIRELKSCGLVAECPCGEEFKLSDAVLFDGLGKFPPKADEVKTAWLEDLKEKIDDLKKRKLSAMEGAEKKAMEVGFGKIIEKIIPTHAAFGIAASDCRPLYEPIDFLAFNGLTEGKLASISFMEIKTGGSRLNGHQKQVKEAVEAKKVSYKEVE